MGSLRQVLAVVVLLATAASASANVPRYYFEDDPNYTSAKIAHMVVPSLLVAWILGWACWAFKGEWWRKLLLLALAGFPMCVLVLPLSAGSYFMAGNRPAGFQRFGPRSALEGIPEESPNPLSVGLQTALIFLACGVIVGLGMAWRHRAQTPTNAEPLEKAT